LSRTVRRLFFVLCTVLLVSGMTSVTTAASAGVCDQQPASYPSAPDGTVLVDPAVDNDLSAKTRANPPGTTFWLKPGTHTLGTDQFGQVQPKDGDVYLGAPGAVLDGRGANNFAFTGQARDVAIRNLTVRGFAAPQDQGVVNHDSGDGWVIENDTIQHNKGAGLMAGARQQVLHNCLRDNGQYGMNAYQVGDGITGLVVADNEIVGNNTDDWENKNPGCGCSGGVKFWAVDGADIRGNWVHDNRGAGLWADTNNNDFLIENNVIENNDGEALFYEISYNLILRNNTIRGNDVVAGKAFAARGDNFPTAAVYLSESGGEPRIPARTDKADIYGNVFESNWSGITNPTKSRQTPSSAEPMPRKPDSRDCGRIGNERHSTLWENADRFCNSPANTSSGDCTRLVSPMSKCTQPGIASEPLYGDCRWKTQHVDVHDNTFRLSPGLCTNGLCGRMAILSNYGTYPDWSPWGRASRTPSRPARTTTGAATPTPAPGHS
jgi:hypothetical protein